MFKILDMEVFAHDWLFAIKDLETGKREFVWNDNEKVRKLLEDDPILITFNGKHYDQYIVKAIMIGADPEMVKEINDFIILEKRQGFEHWFVRQKFIRLNIVDVRDDMQQGHSLKSIEGHLFQPIRESSIPFTIDRPLLPEEREEVQGYCYWDVDMTELIFRERKDYFLTKQDLAREAKLDEIEALGMTNAKLVAKFLGARKLSNTDDERDYVFPEKINQSRMPKIVKFFQKVWDKTIPDDVLWGKKTKLDIVLGGMPTVYGFGGVHGALLNYQENSTEERILLNYDVASLYPSLMLVFEYLSRALVDPKMFSHTYDRRIHAKHINDYKLSTTLKLPLNTAFGAMLNKYNDLYDPLQGRSVCITGQLIITELLLDLLAVTSLTPINFNTDGILFSVNRDKLEEIRNIIRLWEQRFNMTLEEEKVARIVQKDVNNYWMQLENGKVKAKGGYLVYGVPPAGAWSINNNIIGVKKAMMEYFLSGKSVRESIEENQNIFDFQIIAKAGTLYKEAYHLVDGEPVSVQKINRVYATTDTRFGKLIKVKDIDDSESKIPSLPEHCIIDNENNITLAEIDKEWYINYAEEKVLEFLVGKPKKQTRRKKTMATTTKTPQLRLFEKLFELQKAMDSYNWEKDGLNTHQRYKYISEAQYKTNFRKACIKVGLLWKMTTLRWEHIPNISDKMHMIVADFEGKLIDIETGEAETYYFSGSGADNGDKALYKAVTGGFKFFVAGNFNVAEGTEPETDEVSDQAPAYTTPENRQEEKNKLTDPEREATKVQKNAVKKILDRLVKSDPEKQSLYDSIAEKTENFTKMTASYAEEVIETVSQVMEG